jgi:CheY-like chemotaxis protein
MNLQRMPLLLVEDDESLRRFVARHLRGAGYEVAEAASAEEAVAVLAAGLRPGAVLLDLNLPGDTGWDLLRGSAIADAGSPPVVITSATTLSPKRLAEFHVAGYLPKAVPARDAGRNRRAGNPAGWSVTRPMTDLQMLLILAVAGLVLWGYLELCGRVAR